MTALTVVNARRGLWSTLCAMLSTETRRQLRAIRRRRARHEAAGEQLTEQTRQAVLRAVDEGATQAEIARELGVDRSRVFRIIEAARDG